MIFSSLDRLFGRRERPQPIWEVLLIDLSAILLWRGIWGLMDIYLFPTSPQVSFGFSIITGLALIAVIRAAIR